MSIFRNILASGMLAAALATGAAAQAQDIKIGALFPLSGPVAGYGDLFMSGTNLAVEHVNADHMLSGKLSIVYEDSQGAPQRGVIGMNKLVNVEKVPYVLSAFSGVSKAIAPIGERSKTVSVNGGGTSTDLAELGPYFWNILPLVNFEIQAMTPYLVKQRGIKNVALVYLDDLMGQTIKKELEASLPASGGKLVAAFSVPVNTQQFSGVAALVREAKPDAVYSASYGAQQVSMIKQLRDNGVTQPVIGYSGLSLPEILALPEAQGSLFTSQAIDWNSSDPVTKRFVDDFQKKYHKMPEIYAANYYNAVRLFALLASRLQKAGKPITGENLLAERRALKTFELVGGKVTFQPNGTIVAPIQVREVEGKSDTKVLTTVAPGKH